MKHVLHVAFCMVCTVAVLSACRTRTGETVELRSYPMNTMAGVLTSSGVSVDMANSSDGDGSLRIDADKPQTVRLFETGDIDVETARLTYQAHVRTQGMDGQVYLEMWCHFPQKGEYFSRALHAPVTGTTDWVTQETPFFLKQGENPDNIKLNVVVNGTGTVWIDDVRLTRSPL
jgi:hypothetical protein